MQTHRVVKPSFYEIVFGAGGGQGTSGARWFYPGGSDTGANASIRWLAITKDTIIDALFYTNRAAGSGTGSFDVELCTIDLADVVTPTGLLVSVDADVTRVVSMEDFEVFIPKGTLIGVRSTVVGTVTSPASPNVTLRARSA